MTEHEVAEPARSRDRTPQRRAVTNPAVPDNGVYWLLDARTGHQVWPDSWGAEREKIEEWFERAKQRTLADQAL